MLYRTIIVLLFARLALAFSFEAYSAPGYKGTYNLYTSSGTHKPGYIVRSYHWDSPYGDGCCVKMCYNSREVGYWCPSHDNNNVDNGFNKILIGCGDDTLNC